MKYKKLAIFAASGEMPLLAIHNALQSKKDFIIIGFKHISDFQRLNAIKNIKVYSTHIGYLKGILKILKKEKVDAILLSGKVHKVNFYKIIKFDLTTLGLFLKLPDYSDSSILQGVVNYYLKNGIRFISQKEYFSDIVMPGGCITKKKCTKKERANLKWSFGKAKSLAGMNIGQSVLCGYKVVVSVEGIEGTDNMIKRSKSYILKDNCFIKVTRKGHNPVFDLPGFGLNTVKLLSSIGVKMIGLEKDTVLIPDLDRVIEFADNKKMCIYGL